MLCGPTGKVKTSVSSCNISEDTGGASLNCSLCRTCTHRAMSFLLVAFVHLLSQTQTVFGEVFLLLLFHCFRLFPFLLFPVWWCNPVLGCRGVLGCTKPGTGAVHRVTRCNCLTPGQLSALLSVEDTLPNDLQELSTLSTVDVDGSKKMLRILMSR